MTFLQNATVQEAIGAQSNYSECPDAFASSFLGFVPRLTRARCSPYERFVPSGDDGRSTLSDLARVVDTGLRTLIWAGTVDYNCNVSRGSVLVERS